MLRRQVKIKRRFRCCNSSTRGEMTKNSAESWQPRTRHLDSVEGAKADSFDHLEDVRKHDLEHVRNADRRLQGWSRRLFRTRKRTQQRILYCELPDSPPTPSCQAAILDDPRQRAGDNGGRVQDVGAGGHETCLAKAKTRSP